MLTLDDCIETALNRNIQLKRALNDNLVAQSNRMQAIFNFFPSLSAGVNYDYFFGNFFDQNAARQVSEATSSSNPNVSSQLVLFNGFANHANLAQRKHEEMASVANVKATRLDVESTILVNYLTVILDLEALKVERETLDLLASQLDREKKRESVGVGDLESVYSFQSQLAAQRLIVNNLEVKYRRDLLALIQSMQLDITEADYEVAPYEVEEENLLLDVASFDEILEETLQYSPSLQSAQYSMEAAKYNLKATKALRVPTLTLSGAIGSNYSSNGARNPSTGEFEPQADVWDQLNYNEFEYINFSLSIPIFSRFRNGNSIQLSKISYANAELALQEAYNDITNLVQAAYLDLVSAQNTYATAKENLEVSEQSFQFMKKRFETGNTDFYTYMESVNVRNRAQMELVNAKYSIIFRQKVLELYRGS